MTETKTILVFSAELQRESEHEIDIDGNGEVVLTCKETGHALKFPAGTTADALKVLLAAHKDANVGQISVAELEAKKAELLKGFE